MISSSTREDYDKRYNEAAVRKMHSELSKTTVRERGKRERELGEDRRGTRRTRTLATDNWTLCNRRGEREKDEQPRG